MKKQALNKIALELGLKVALKDSVGEILLAIRRLIDEDIDPGDHLMGFDKHADLTYKQVQEEHADYCDWAQVVNRTEASPGSQLVAFCNFLNRHAPAESGSAAAASEAMSARERLAKIMEGLDAKKLGESDEKDKDGSEE